LIITLLFFSYFKYKFSIFSAASEALQLLCDAAPVVVINTQDKNNPTPVIPIKISEKKRKNPESSTSSNQIKTVNSDIDPKRKKAGNNILSTSLATNKPKATLVPFNRSFIDKIGDLSAFELKKKKEKEKEEEKEKADQKTFVITYSNTEYYYKGYEFCRDIELDDIIPKGIVRKVSKYGLGLEFPAIQYATSV
jgi:hypothetical protein